MVNEKKKFTVIVECLTYQNTTNTIIRKFTNFGDAATFAYYCADRLREDFDDEDFTVDITPFDVTGFKNMFSEEYSDFEEFAQICDAGNLYCECLEDCCDICNPPD